MLGSWIPATLLAAENNLALDPAFQPSTTFYQTDQDHDGLDDSIEMALAQRFAPEYRFYQRMDDSRLMTPDPLQQSADPTATPRRSSQNQSERFFPCAVENFLHDPVPTGPTDCVGTPVIYFHAYLDRITPSWKLAQWITHRGWSESIAIEFWTFYTYDDKGLRGWLDHVGDWEHINLRITRYFDTTGKFLNDEITDAIYYGHGTERILSVDAKTNRCTKLATKGLRIPAKSLLLVDQTHPMVFVSAGTHAAYPWPGIWQNLLCEGANYARIGTYDDLFLDNGKVLSGWKQVALINLGEVDQAAADDPLGSRDPKKICARRRELDPGMMCDTRRTAAPAAPMLNTKWNGEPRPFGQSRDLRGKISSPVAPGLHNEWGIFDPIDGYPYSGLPNKLTRLTGLDHTTWDDVIRQTAKIPDGLGTLHTSRHFMLP